MPPLISLVRHAQAEHNVDHRYHLRDPLLTTLGKQQCSALRSGFAPAIEVSCIMSSPSKRAVQTAVHSFGPILAESDATLLLIPLAQEVAASPCDIGYPWPILEEQLSEVFSENEKFDVSKLDGSLVHDGWESKTGIYKPSFPAVEERAARLRSWLWQRPEKHIVLVSHGAIMHYVIEDFSFFDPAKGTGWENCEVRIFKFTDESNEQEAHLQDALRPQHVNVPRTPDTHTNVLTDS